MADLFETAAAPDADIEVVRLFGPHEDHSLRSAAAALARALPCPALRGALLLRPGRPERVRLDLLRPRDPVRLRATPHRPGAGVRLLECLQIGDHPGSLGQTLGGARAVFAEAFFERGVGGFVCTAWPVNDAAAQNFATATLYGGLLGLPRRLAAMARCRCTAR